MPSRIFPRLRQSLFGNGASHQRLAPLWPSDPPLAARRPIRSRICRRMGLSRRVLLSTLSQYDGRAVRRQSVGRLCDRHQNLSSRRRPLAELGANPFRIGTFFRRSQTAPIQYRKMRARGGDRDQRPAHHCAMGRVALLSRRSHLPPRPPHRSGK